MFDIAGAEERHQSARVTGTPITVPPATGSAQAGDILEMLLSLMVNDMDETKRVYRDVLGFTVEGKSTFTEDSAMRRLP